MDEVEKLLKSPAFWVGSGLMSVIFSLLSAYFKDWIDRTRAELSDKWRKQSEEHFQAFLAEAHALSRSTEDMDEMFQAETRDRLKVIRLLLLMLFLALIYFGLPKDSTVYFAIGWILLLLICFMIITFFVVRPDAARMQILLEQAWQFRRDERGSRQADG